ncbi:MAG TPA: NAD-dependent malic enzyme [Acidobacteriota bacterium]|nr:NAD-dependent malic enzyme [Acidobacteriota bacterium]
MECPHAPGWIARISGVIADQGGAIEAIDLVHIHKQRSLRDYTIECTSAEQEQQMIEALKEIEGVSVQSVSDDTFLLHLGGKLEVQSRVQLNTRSDLSMVYTPGVARVCKRIESDPRTSFNLTIRKNCIAVVSDGSAVLGLGNIGAEAAMPVMEGKAVLFKEFGGVDAFPLCIATQDPEEIIHFCKLIAPSFGGINLEDISAPRCFEIEQRLVDELDIPVFHDDQHGTAVVVLAALINTLKLTGRKAEDIKLVIAGAGASGFACCQILSEFGVENIIVCDRQGAIHQGREFKGNPAKAWLAHYTNPEGVSGSLQQALEGADMFLGLSAPNLIKREDVLRMNPDPIIFAMSNPTPEVMPEAVEGVAAVIATGRSDYVNQINNVLAFPGIFRGALDARASAINQDMKQAAAMAIAQVITEEELSRDYIIPSAFNRKVYKQVAAAVAKAAHRSGVAHRMPKGIHIGA